MAKTERLGKPNDLLYVETQYRADLCESAVNATGELGHTCCGSETNQRNDQTILDQALTRFILVQANQRTQN